MLPILAGHGSARCRAGHSDVVRVVTVEHVASLFWWAGQQGGGPEVGEAEVCGDCAWLGDDRLVLGVFDHLCGGELGGGLGGVKVGVGGGEVGGEFFGMLQSQEG